MSIESSVLSYLAGVSIRSLCLLALAAAAIGCLRVRTPAARHAVWSATMAGMLLLAALSPLAPPVPLRVLTAAPVQSLDLLAPSAPASPAGTFAPVKPPAVPTRSHTWADAAAALYLLIAAAFLIRLAFGYQFTRRLLQSSDRVELGPEPTFESTWISVPLTVGWLRPRILLPADWREWEPAKLAAVLAHERTHVRRADWGIALLAGVNRCIFWFHPLAWWLERRLAVLAEQACDDAALLEMGSREPYAQALLDMAAAVKTGQGRLVWEAMAMAKASEVRMRIERILDETRQVPRGVSRRRWAILAACSLPLIYAASVLQLEPARAQDQQAAAGVSRMTAADAARMEQQLASSPDDLATRSRLIGYYFLNNVREPRLAHIFWMIENHPESELAGFNSAGISPRNSSLNTAADYQRAASTWQQEVAIHPKDAKVLANAAQFYSQPGGDWYEAERLLQQSGDMAKLGQFYGRVLKAPADTDQAFAAHVTTELDSSTDPMLLRNVGGTYMAKARELGGPSFAPRPPGRQQINPPPLEGVQVFDVPQAPQVLNKVEPQYPPLALQSKIQGDVHLMVTIGTDGHVKLVTLMGASPALGSSAFAAVQQWTFAPVLQNGVPVVARFPVKVPFRIAGEPEPKPLAATPPPAVPQRIRVGGNVQMASLIHKVDPVYPDAARTAGPDGGALEGTVRLTVMIGTDGHVTSVQAIEGHPLLGPAAEEAVMQWVYKVTLLNGNPVNVITTVDLNFKP